MLSSPTLLTDQHRIDLFCCGVDSLDTWLQRRALANQVSGASRTYVVADEGRVVGFYCLSSGAIAATAAPGTIRRNMPNPIPMAILGRLAIDVRQQGKGLGVALLQDAVLRASQAAEILGIKGILVHAISEQVASFYSRYGFVAAPAHPLTLVLSLKGGKA